MTVKAQSDTGMNDWKAFKRQLENCGFHGDISSDVPEDTDRIPDSLVPVMRELCVRLKRMDDRLAGIMGRVQSIEERIRKIETQTRGKR